MTVHRRLTNDDKDSSKEATNDNDSGNGVTIQLDGNQNIITTTALEIGDTSTTSSSCDVITEVDEDEEIDDLVDDLQRDAESLLSRPSSNKHGTKCCELPYKVGNCTVLLPSLFVRTGLGIVGKMI